MTIDDYVDSLKSAFLVVGKKAAMVALLAEVPCLATNPICAKVIEEIVGEILKKMLNQAEMRAFFIYTDVRVNKQGKEFSEASYKYHSAPEEEKSKYEKELIDSFKQFVKYSS